MFATTLVGTSRSAALACLIGITLAASEAKLGPLVQLVSKQNRRRNKVKRQRRFGTEVEAASIAAAQIKTLIDSLSRCQQSLDCDIATEEERTRCSDDSDPAYSVFARSLIPRRDNVAATIAILQERLSKTELLIYRHWLGAGATTACMNLQRADVLKGQATAFNWLAASELAQRRRLRMASSTSARACLASRASSSAACARNSTAVSLSSAATIRDWASFKALAASCSLQ